MCFYQLKLCTGLKRLASNLANINDLLVSDFLHSIIPELGLNIYLSNLIILNILLLKSLLSSHIR